MIRSVLPWIVIALLTTPALAHPDPTRNNAPHDPRGIQRVTGEELVAARDTLNLLLLELYGVLPEGVAAFPVQRCLVSDVMSFFEHAEIRTPAGLPGGCVEETYARACQSAAGRHRSTCEGTCQRYRVLGDDHRRCRGNDRPTIETFSEARHCFAGDQNATVVSCIASGPCRCTP